MRIVLGYLLAAIGSLVTLAGGYFLVALTGLLIFRPAVVPLSFALMTANLFFGGAVLCGLSLILLRRRSR